MVEARGHGSALPCSPCLSLSSTLSREQNEIFMVLQPMRHLYPSRVDSIPADDYRHITDACSKLPHVVLHAHVEKYHVCRRFPAHSITLPSPVTIKPACDNKRSEAADEAWTARYLRASLAMWGVSILVIAPPPREGRPCYTLHPDRFPPPCTPSTRW